MSAATPYTEPCFRVPGYTGYICGLAEVHGQTPVLAQATVKNPKEGDFLHIREHREFIGNPSCDPCNSPDTYKPCSDLINLWPNLQHVGRQDSAKPPQSHLALGDQRISPYTTSYKSNYDAPFEEGRIIRSPLRNKTLQGVADLREVYRSAFQRVGDKRLTHMLAHMKERIAGKIGNANDNAFKVRKLFKMYDATGSGSVDIEDFRVITESFGMQLDDDSLLALFSRYDKLGKGTLEYEPLMRMLLDADYYPLYQESCMNTQAQLGADKARHVQEQLRVRCQPKAQKLQQVFAAFDTVKCGVLERQQFFAASAACGLLFSERECEEILSTIETSSQGLIVYQSFINKYTQGHTV